jgi:hypothetical protein
LLACGAQSGAQGQAFDAVRLFAVPQAMVKAWPAGGDRRP